MFDVSANYKNGQLTNGVYANLWGDEINFSDKAMSSFYAFDINSKFNYKSLSVNVLADCYAPTSPDYISPQENKFESLLGNINYDWKVNEAFTIKPSFRYSRHRPWQVNAVEDDYIYNQTAQRFSPAMSAIFTVSNNFNIVSGVEYTYDYAKNNIEGEMYMNDKNTIVFNNIAFYLQSYLQTNFANFIVGGRLDRHNLGGIAFSPRLGIIKTLNDFNYKLLYSRTFKSPSISTYDINSDIKPEKTDIFEFQMGYKLGASSFVSANLFDITIHKPIVYYYDAITYESFYENFEKTGSRGFELEYIFMKRNTYISANYSYYHASGKNKVEKYNVYDEALNVISSQLLGAPQSKFVVYGYSTLFDNFTVTGSFVLKSPKYAYLTADYVEGTTPEEDYIIPLIGKMPRTYLLNAGIRFTNVWREGVHLGLNVFDILNQKPLIPQGYDGELQPYPSRGREFVFQVQFNVFRK